MLAIFRFTDRETGELAGHITAHDGSPECEQLKRAGYTPVFFEHEQAMNYVDTQGEFERLAGLYQPDIEYVGAGGLVLPVQRNKHGQATFGGLVVKEGETNEEREESTGGFLIGPEPRD